jgi:hypothetical protein
MLFPLLRLAVLAGALTGPALPAQAPAGKTPAAGTAQKTGVSPRPEAAPRKPPLPDAELEKEIRARFQKSKISSENFQVRVQRGVATIDGKTSVVQRKGTATRLARLAGARNVVNRIEVSEAAKRKASENLAAGRRRVQVKRSER